MSNELAVKAEESSDLLTPEELAMLKKLQARRKAQVKQMGGIKESLFKTLTENFASTISRIKKDVVTVSLKEKFSDGNIYAVTFGVDDETPEGQEEIDAHKLALQIITDNIETIEPVMGISNSLRVSGTFEGKKLFWQIRKRAA